MGQYSHWTRAGISAAASQVYKYAKKYSEGMGEELNLEKAHKAQQALNAHWNSSETLVNTEKAELIDKSHGVAIDHMNIDVAHRRLYGLGHGRIKVNANYQKLTGCPAGTVGYDIIGSIATPSAVLVSPLGPTMPSDFAYGWVDSYFNHNPYVKDLGTKNGIWMPVANGTNPAMDKIALTHVRHDFTFVNAQNTDAFVELYAFIAKEDGKWDPYGVMDQLDQDYGLGATNVVSANPGTTGTGTIGYTTPTVPGGTFWSFPGFNRYFKCVGKKKFQLGAGSTYRLIVNTKYGRVFSKEALQMAYNNGNTAAFKGKTIWFITRTLGQGVVDKTAGASLFTYSSASVGVIANVQKTFHLVDGNDAKIDLNLCWSNIPAGATNANQSLVGVLDTVVSTTKAN